MQQVVFAIRRYAELAPKPNSIHRFNPNDINNLSAWLKKDVCNAIRPFLIRVKFQEHAAWALRHLVAGTKTQERRAIEAVDRALSACASQLTEIAAIPNVRIKLQEQNPPYQKDIATCITIGDPTPQVHETRRIMIDNLREGLAYMEHIRDHFWTDLVCTDDYFAPWGGLSGNMDNEPASRFLNSQTRQLHPIGDLVTECLLQRVDQLHQKIREFQSKCLRALSSLARAMPTQHHKCTKSLEKLDEKIATLKSLVTYDPFTIRSACVALTQLYLCFNPEADVAWLGLDERSILIGSESLTAHSSGSRNVEFFDQVAIALRQLRKLYEGEPAHQSALDEAIAGNGLVIDEVSETAYWEGDRIVTSWSAKSWTLLIALARASRSESSITDTDVYDPRDRSTGNPLPQLINRLKQKLPPSLKKSIEPGVQKGSYRLKVPMGSTHIFSKT